MLRKTQVAQCMPSTSMAGQLVLAVFISFLMFHKRVAQHCGTNSYSIYQMMLKGHTYMRIKARPSSLDCKQACDSDVRCQSYNYVMFQDICELNTRTKEARPDDFIKRSDRYYVTKAPYRGRLGSIPELSAESCAEIKASEGEHAVSGEYWLDPGGSGTSHIVHCDMSTSTPIADYCKNHHCPKNATCVNSRESFMCRCNSPGWTGDQCDKDIDECEDGLHNCHTNAQCQNEEGSFKCNCNPGFTGDGTTNCEDVNECNVDLHKCHSDANCENTEGSYNCTCKPEYIGDGFNCRPEECQNYLKLTDSKRNSLTLWTLCDNELVPNWYRFTNDAGTTMRTSCPAMDACGTVKPGWLDGDHPSASDGRVTRKVCFKDVVGVQPNCCNSSAFIKVFLTY